MHVYEGALPTWMSCPWNEHRCTTQRLHANINLLIPAFKIHVQDIQETCVTH